jgi:hypothetical protein
MHMKLTSIETPSSAAAYAATGASCRQKPFGLLRSDDNQALAGGCSR